MSLLMQVVPVTSCRVSPADGKYKSCSMHLCLNSQRSEKYCHCTRHPETYSSQALCVMYCTFTNTLIVNTHIKKSVHLHLMIATNKMVISR